MTSHAFRAITATTVFGGFMGLVAAGVWAVDQPEVTGELLEVVDSDTDYPGVLPFPTTDLDPTFTGAGFWDLAPVPDNRLPVSLWLALPLSTAAAGGIVGAAATAAGIRLTRNA